MVKRVRRLVSGTCEVARICGQTRDASTAPVPHTPAMTAAFWNEWRTSIRLGELFRRSGRDPALNIDDTVQDICRAKTIPSDAACVNNLRSCVSDIRSVNETIATLKHRAEVKFNSSDAEHEDALERLWQTLLPGETREGGRFSKDWGRIGFQQSDPASDFRGGGVLSLDQLLHFATARPTVARRMIVEPAAEISRYPWACVGINLTHEVLRVLDEQWLNVVLFGKSPQQAIEVVHGVYGDMFEILHAKWVAAKPLNLLDFPAVRKEAMFEIDKELLQNGVLVPPGTEA